jgi:DNA-binding MarR family transcriptional regulator
MELEEEIKQKKFKNVHEKALVNIIYTSSWLNNLTAAFLKRYQITPQQYNILRILRGQHPQPASVNLLIERMLDKMSNASRLVDKLLLKGFVDRRICERDRRQVDVIISESGLKLLEKLDRDMEQLFSKLHQISDSEAAELNKLLDKLRG